MVYPEGGPIIELAYDGLNRCVRTRVNGAGVVHVYDGLQRIQDRDEHTGDLLAEYTYVQGQLHKWRTPSSAHWVFTEPQGGWPRHIFDDAGVLTDSFDVDWNGQELLHQGTTDAPIGWGGGWKLASDTDLPILLMPGTNEIWYPKLGKSLNPLVSMSSALTLTTAIGGYTGEVIGLPVKLPAIPSWGSGPGYPWWPGSQGPGGPMQMRNDGGMMGAGGGLDGQGGGITGGSKKSSTNPCPLPSNSNTPCDCCKEPAPGPSGVDPCKTSFADAANLRVYLPGMFPFDPSRPPFPTGPVVKPDFPDCTTCLWDAIAEARRILNQNAGCAPADLYTCGMNALNSTTTFVCSWSSSLYLPDSVILGCTFCSGWVGDKILINCGKVNGSHRTTDEKARTIVHELIHWCRHCVDHRGECNEALYNLIQQCQIHICDLNCPGLLSPGHEDACYELGVLCAGLVISCDGWVCITGTFHVMSGYAVDIWGARPVQTVPFQCWYYVTSRKKRQLGQGRWPLPHFGGV